MYFQYDANGIPLGFFINDIPFHYITNQMGDVIALTDYDGNVFAEYVYDEWGKLLDINTIEDGDWLALAFAEANPIRYRGYFYDNETGYYYLQSRYYDPSIGRFINADDVHYTDVNSVCGLNIFAYCGNDPINNDDPEGKSTYKITAVGLQLEFSASLFGYSGEVGIEFIYVFSKNCIYGYAYGGLGAGGGFGKKGLEYFKNSFRHIAMSPKVSLKNICNMFKLNTSFSAGIFIVKTTSKFKWPNGYCGSSTSSSMTIHKVKGYYGKGDNCKTYGICYSTGVSFCFSKTAVYYQRISVIYDKVKQYLKAQKNNIKNAID